MIFIFINFNYLYIPYYFKDQIFLKMLNYYFGPLYWVFPKIVKIMLIFNLRLNFAIILNCLIFDLNKTIKIILDIFFL